MKEQFYSYVLIVAVVVIVLEWKDKDEVKNKKLKKDELIVGEVICVAFSFSLFVKMNRVNW